MIRFTHSKIKPIFSDGRTVEGTLSEISEGKLKPENLPKIVVHKQDDKTYFSMNNRRLWVFKECRKRGLLEKVPERIRPMPTNKRQKNRFTTERCALNAKFMHLKTGPGGAEDKEESEEEEE
uniref:Uncharacterized protein n=1 Tax=Arcella intermedia TaxID=1963864 RepID=A0A6B2LQW6_9EUKA